VMSNTRQVRTYQQLVVIVEAGQTLVANAGGN
jgi:hypothetical protein